MEFTGSFIDHKGGLRGTTGLSSKFLPLVIKEPCHTSGEAPGPTGSCPVPIMHWEEAEALSFAHGLYPASTLASHSNFSALHP